MRKTSDRRPRLRLVDVMEAVIELKSAVEFGFARVDRRFELSDDKMNRRFDAVYQQIDKMEARFEQRFDDMDRRFDAVDSRVGALEQQGA